MPGCLHPDLGKTEERAAWHEDIKKQDHGKDAPVPEPKAQPKMQADSKMSPD